MKLIYFYKTQIKEITDLIQAEKVKKEKYLENVFKNNILRLFRYKIVIEIQQLILIFREKLV